MRVYTPFFWFDTKRVIFRKSILTHQTTRGTIEYEVLEAWHGEIESAEAGQADEVCHALRRVASAGRGSRSRGGCAGSVE